MAKKSKVPKTIAGVKLPKPLRRGLRELAATQRGRDALTEAFDAAGAALAAGQEAQAADGAGKPARKKTDDRAAAVRALEAAARSFTDTLRRRPAEAVAAPVPSGPPPSAVTH